MEFKKYTISELATLKYGKMLPSSDFTDTGYPVYSGYRVTGHTNKFLYENPMLVIVARGVGGTGDVKISPPKSWITNLSIVLDINEKIADKYFLKSLLNIHSLKDKLDTGSAQSQITIEVFSKYEIQLPDISYQIKISYILSTYDNLIENNQRRIRILEEMAQSIYREWFVNFRFPGHEKIKMIDSSLGPIPQGWELKNFIDCAFVHRGRSYRSENLEKPNGFPFVNLKCIDRDGGFRKNGLKSYSGDYKETHKVVCGDIVMAVTDMTQERRIVARCGLVPTMPQPFGVISMDLVKIEPKDKSSRLYIYALLRWSGFADSVKQFANGANVLHLSPDHIKNYQCLWPDQAYLESFSELISPLLVLIDNLNQQNELLSIKRDMLLPKLISGEIDLSTEAYKLREAA